MANFSVTERQVFRIIHFVRILPSFLSLITIFAENSIRKSRVWSLRANVFCKSVTPASDALNEIYITKLGPRFQLRTAKEHDKQGTATVAFFWIGIAWCKQYWSGRLRMDRTTCTYLTYYVLWGRKRYKRKEKTWRKGKGIGERKEEAMLKRKKTWTMRKELRKRKTERIEGKWNEVIQGRYVVADAF